VNRVLLDTHALLWFLFDDPRLSDGAASYISDPAREKLVSVASLWEITIKCQLGKLRLGMDLEVFLREYVEHSELTVVPLEISHLVVYERLPLHHRDPFDRLLIAQAIALGVPIITADANFAAYDVAVKAAT